MTQRDLHGIQDSTGSTRLYTGRRIVGTTTEQLQYLLERLVVGFLRGHEMKIYYWNRIDTVDYKDYYQVVGNPVFGKDIYDSLKTGGYTSAEECVSHLNMMVHNMMLYFKDRDEDIYPKFISSFRETFDRILAGMPTSKKSKMLVPIADLPSLKKPESPDLKRKTRSEDPRGLSPASSKTSSKKRKHQRHVFDSDGDSDSEISIISVSTSSGARKTRAPILKRKNTKSPEVITFSDIENDASESKEYNDLYKIKAVRKNSNGSVEYFYVKNGAKLRSGKWSSEKELMDQGKFEEGWKPYVPKDAKRIITLPGLECHFCIFCLEFDQKKNLLLCSNPDCMKIGHQACWELTQDVWKNIHSKDPPTWRCIDCKLCEECKTDEHSEKLVICDGCDLAIHTTCLDPPLDAPPKGNFYCPACSHDGQRNDSNVDENRSPASTTPLPLARSHGSSNNDKGEGVLSDKQPKKLRELSKAAILKCSDCHEEGDQTKWGIADPLWNVVVTRNDWRCDECKVCEACEKDDYSAELLLCDGCDRAYHKKCHSPPIIHLPEESFYCSKCKTRPKSVKEASISISKDLRKENVADDSYIGSGIVVEASDTPLALTTSDDESRSSVKTTRRSSTDKITSLLHSSKLMVRAPKSTSPKTVPLFFPPSPMIAPSSFSSDTPQMIDVEDVALLNIPEDDSMSLIPKPDSQPSTHDHSTSAPPLPSLTLPSLPSPTKHYPLSESFSKPSLPSLLDYPFKKEAPLPSLQHKGFKLPSTSLLSQKKLDQSVEEVDSQETQLFDEPPTRSSSLVAVPDTPKTANKNEEENEVNNNLSSARDSLPEVSDPLSPALIGTSPIHSLASHHHIAPIVEVPASRIFPKAGDVLHTFPTSKGSSMKLRVESVDHATKKLVCSFSSLPEGALERFLRIIEDSEL